MHYIKNRWIEGTEKPFHSISPTLEAVVWKGKAASSEQIHEAVEGAEKALGTWAYTPLADRIKILENIVQKLAKESSLFAETIAKETGKAYWESLEEALLLPQKFHFALKAYKDRQKTIQTHLPNSTSVTTLSKPLGITVVIGPFNFPLHLPNGHILPALLAGNCVLFKPSEKAPACAEHYIRSFENAGLPEGTIQLLQGDAKTAKTLICHPKINGVFFTGSRGAGVGISKLLAERPEVLLALEMGGNNPLYIETFSPLDKVVDLAIASCFITSGQRCSCARRLLLKDTPETQTFIEAFIAKTKRLTIGIGSAKNEVYLGSLISSEAAFRVLSSYLDLKKKGAKPLLAPRHLEALPKAFLSPGIVDVSSVPHDGLTDEEIFGPLVQIKRVSSLEEAVALSNATEYGLSASIVSDQQQSWEYFLRHCQAGVININVPTTGAYSGAPFGGIKKSGNMRPSGFYASDYCSYPCASRKTSQIIKIASLPPFATR